MTLQLDENTTVLSILERIANTQDRIAGTQYSIASTLERIEIVLEEKENKTLESKECRQLMQDICKHYKETKPSYFIQIGSQLNIYRFRNAIATIKNIRNTKFETRRLNKWIRNLEEHEFIYRNGSDMLQILDTGKDWGEL